MALAAALNFFPLSEEKILGNPLRAVKRFRLLTKAIVLTSGTSSRWTARMTQQV